jgi:uncharacterized protein (UPF0264 family)
VPVSAALGELLEGGKNKESFLLPGLAGVNHVKWGLAGCGGHEDWPKHLAEAGMVLQQRYPDCRPVAVAYADWQRACAPRPDQVLRFARAHGWKTLLVDTWKKDGTTLLDWLRPPMVVRLRSQCRESGIRLALAGSLGPSQIKVLLPVAPDWFAVRGAVCHRSRREAAIDAKAVRRLAGLLRTPDQP